MLAQARDGDGEARRTLVEENLGLVKSVVVRFAGRGEELDDLIQLGCVGLLKALDRFDPGYGVQFSTYAVPSILGEVRRHFRDTGPVHLGRRLKELARKAGQAEEALCQELGRHPTVAELAERLGVPAPDIVAALEGQRPLVPLDSPLPGRDEDSLSAGERLVSPGRGETGWLDSLSLRGALKSLSQRERELIYLRYYRDLTQEEVASRLGLSQVQVSRLERKCLLAVRERLAASGR